MKRVAYGTLREVEYIKTIEYAGIQMDIAKVERVKGQIAYFGYSNKPPYDNWLISLDLYSLESCFSVFIRGREKDRSRVINKSGLVNIVNKNLILWRRKK